MNATKKGFAVGDTIKNGATILAIHAIADRITVLCRFRGDREFVTWRLDTEGNAFWGHYCGTDRAAAEADFSERCEASIRLSQ
jgi:hypothetical protein